MAMQSQDIIRQSATHSFTPAPRARDHQEEVAKLIDVTTCIGCKACQVACSEWNDIRDEVGFNVGVYDNPTDLTAKSWTVMRFSEVEEHGKVGVGQEPACVKTCPTGAIHFGTKEDMKNLASERVTELKGRGYQNAGLYDPQGVGGTHVMYVLHHADKPQLYHGLPDNPTISSAVTFWKGIWKPLAAVGFAATFAASIFHYVGIGPNRTNEQDEEHARQDDEIAEQSTNEEKLS
ncbi:formate dehydrogenase N subunit beta transmembrane domain-containing protein [Photorhabdus aegyptia]|uniref:Fe-S-cluster-containing hydrogenase subunit n=1 Tax=Photorhabdus aegyptia TaxID=2805098 RepID=A0A022PE43_9GAMM|nr:formate dehydrogenase N subunit beta transmembrane domain-containing protein [Photorhabdus aegyptia]EYU13946.1 Fe-S-cluster-containing hydrogenase subunit [Photorhabdus aegyptia]